MRLRQTATFLMFASCILFGVLKNYAAEVHNGSWTFSKSSEPGKVDFTIIEHNPSGTSTHESDLPIGLFIGVDFSKPGQQDVRFTISRDAGKIECEGFLHDGEGAGNFHFQSDPNYLREMDSIGFKTDEEKQFSMTVQDVSLEFARQMKNEHLDDLDADKLIALRIFNVNAAFIEELRATGLKISDSNKLVAFRINGASPEWIAELKERGYDRVELEQLIAFRIHGVSPEFIDKLQSLGYRHPDPDQLVAMRIHDVTPEYISNLRTHGIQNLTIDQLVSMRIHGID
jgi:hypothetical protein